MANKAPGSEVDAYTQHVLSNVDPDVFRTLNLVQLESLRRAISATAPFRRHGVDIRGVLPLYFGRFYFVFLMGRDRRSSTRERESRRYQMAKGTSLLLFVYVLATLSIPMVLLILYVLKSAMGIDIFPDQHLSDFF